MRRCKMIDFRAAHFCSAEIIQQLTTKGHDCDTRVNLQEKKIVLAEQCLQVLHWLTPTLDKHEAARTIKKNSPGRPRVDKHAELSLGNAGIILSLVSALQADFQL